MKLRLLAPALLVVACDAVIGVEPLPAWPCPECMAASCRAELVDCYDADGCRDWHACAMDCGSADLGCLVECNERFPKVSRTSEARALAACRAGTCVDACVETKAYLPSVFPEECGPCVSGICGDRIADCLSEPACVEALRCGRACADPECALRCAYDVGGDDAVDPIDLLGDCLGDCGTACRAGELYACAGAYSWGAPAARMHTPFTMRISVDATESAVGYQLNVCRVTPCDPLDSDFTDDRGRATVLLPMTAVGFFGGYFEVTAPPGAEEIVPNRFEPGRPYTRSERRVGFPVFTRSLLEDLARSFDAELDPQRGHIGWNAWDCMFDQAVGLRVHIDADFETAFYSRPYPTVDDGSYVTTDAGAGSFVNVEPGRHRIWGTLDGDVVVGDVEIEVYPGTVTGVHLHPIVRQR